MKQTIDRTKKAMQLYREHGGFLRTAEALHLGIYPRELYAMKSAGILEEVTRGLYRLSQMPIPPKLDLVTVALKVPKGIICLISALAFHEITLQIPHRIDVALEAGSIRPRLDYPPTRFVWVSGEAFSSGIETHTIAGAKVKIYSAEKTIVDCFRFRNKVGLDVALEALKEYREKKRFKVDLFIRYAKICRVEKIMTPYLEALL